MAIDTQNKRRSVAWTPPVPDGTIGAADRPHVAWRYAGITITGAESRFIAFTVSFADARPLASVSDVRPLVEFLVGRAT